MGTDCISVFVLMFGASRSSHSSSRKRCSNSRSRGRSSSRCSRCRRKPQAHSPLPAVRACRLSLRFRCSASTEGGRSLHTCFRRLSSAVLPLVGSLFGLLPELNLFFINSIFSVTAPHCPQVICLNSLATAGSGTPFLITPSPYNSLGLTSVNIP